jgi:hypothetical protein
MSIAVTRALSDDVAGPLPRWLRIALLAAAAMNALAGIGFASGARPLLDAAGIPAPDHAFYGLLVGLFVLLFGVGNYCAAVAERPERLFIALSGFGKIAFFALVVALYAAGMVPARAPLAASADLFFGALFVAWLLGAGASRE